MPLADYLSLLRPGGHFVTVGAPETDSIPKISPFVFIMGESAVLRDLSLLTQQATSTSGDLLSDHLPQPSPRC